MTAHEIDSLKKWISDGSTSKGKLLWDLENEKKEDSNLIKQKGERLPFEGRLEQLIENSEKVLPLQTFLQAGETTATFTHFRKEIWKHRRPKNMLGY